VSLKTIRWSIWIATVYHEYRDIYPVTPLTTAAEVQNEVPRKSAIIAGVFIGRSRFCFAERGSQSRKRAVILHDMTGNSRIGTWKYPGSISAMFI
jgi:hypothetical protein